MPPQPPPMADFQVGVLIPVNKNLEEDGSVSKLPILEGENSIGRNEILVADKRLSRKHLVLSASADGSAELMVEGTNPVVINSANGRRKLSTKERAPVKDGDVIELIPGQYFFKYVSLVDVNKSSPFNKLNASNGGHKETGKKRMRRESEEIPNVNIKVQNKAESTLEEQSLGVHRPGSSHSKKHIASSSNNYQQTLSHFHISNEELPSTFRLMSVQGLPSWANTSCVSIGDVIQGDILVAILSNYMVDLDWLLSACPVLKKVPHVLVVHGEGDGTLEYPKMTRPSNWILHKPPLPISYGTHHSKAMLLVYPRGVRIVVHTANLIFADWNKKSQGLWMQDFPWKEQSNNKGSDFETDLIDYLSVLKFPEFSANLPTLGSFKINSSFFKKFDYGDAMVRLVGSVPGYHTGANLRKWGHMKLRSILEKCSFDKQFKRSPLVYQFSSLGSLDEKWMAELKSSMSSGTSDDKTPLGLGEPLLVWPSVEDVRCSLEGYAAGGSIPGPQKNVEKAFLKKYWAKWKASHTGRCRAMPHIKTYVRYNGQNIAWFLLSSSNLSKAAWGALQKNNTQLMIRSYELGVLYLPSLIKKGSGFSCTDYNFSVKDEKQSLDGRTQKAKLVTLTWNENGSSDSNSELVVRLPIPYQLPPPLYSAEDVPWSWDGRYQKKDVYGQVWPRSVKLYASQDG